jgi:four helix bundle protein
MLAQNSKVKSQNCSLKLKPDLRQRCYNFSIFVIKFIEKLPQKRTFWIISDQLLRSATSIGANVVEAKSSSSRREFIKFYEIALKSANETKYWLELLRDATEISKKEIEILLKECEEISKMLAKSLLTLKDKRF